MRFGAIAFAVPALALVGTSHADVIFTTSYNDLAGNFTLTGADSGTFTALASDISGLRSSGEVSRGDDNPQFDPGFANGPTLADFSLTMNLTSITAASAQGMGTLTITDVDGDTLTADLVGQWINLPLPAGAASFFGTLTNVVFSDPNGTFDGTDGNFISTNFAPLLQPFTGAGVLLQIQPSGNFFTQNFSNVSTDFDAQLVPTGGAVSLLAVAGVVATRRRRA